MTASSSGESRSIARVVRWVVPSVGALPLIFIVAFMYVMQVRFLADSDTGWHIRTGDLIMRTGHVPVTDPFSFTVPGREWFAWEWLSDVIMSVLHQRSGLSGVLVFFFAALALAHWLLHRVMKARGTDPALAMVVLCVFAFCSAVHWLARPHMLSILLIVVWSVLVEGFRRGRSRSIWWTPPLIVLWANLHAAFVVAVAMLVVYAVGEWLEAAARGERWSADTRRMLRTYAAVAALSLLAGFATPYGARLYVHIAGYLGDVDLLRQIDEFQSPNFHDITGRLAELMIGLAVVAAARAARDGRYVEPLLTAMWVHLSLQSARHMPLAAAVLAPIVAEQWHGLLRELALATGLDRAGGIAGVFRRLHAQAAAVDGQVNNGVLYAGLAVFFGAQFVHAPLRLSLLPDEFPERAHPVAAARFIEREQTAGRLTGRMFAPDQFGGYLIYRFDGRLKVFFDGRSDLYNGPVFADALRIARAEPGWDATLSRYGVQWLLLHPDDALSVTAQSSGKWNRIYRDAKAEILVRRGAVAASTE
jgi:hypothetical protein